MRGMHKRELNIARVIIVVILLIGGYLGVMHGVSYAITRSGELAFPKPSSAEKIKPFIAKAGSPAMRKLTCAYVFFADRWAGRGNECAYPEQFAVIRGKPGDWCRKLFDECFSAYLYEKAYDGHEEEIRAGIGDYLKAAGKRGTVAVLFGLHDGEAVADGYNPLNEKKFIQRIAFMEVAVP